MAWSITQVGSVSGTAQTLTTASFTSKEHALYLLVSYPRGLGDSGFGAYAYDVSGDHPVPGSVQSHFGPWGGIVGTQSIDSSELTALTFRCTGATDTLDVIHMDSNAGANQARIYEIVNTEGVPIGLRQEKAGENSATTTNPVTLDAAANPDSLCVYIGQWQDAADGASPGSGWTELTDASATDTRIYVQHRTSPSGLQSGQVSAIASQDAVAWIFEFEELKRGWGVPI